MTNIEIQSHILDYLRNDSLSANDDNRVISILTIYDIFKDEPNVNKEDIANAIASWEGVTTLNDQLQSRISIPKKYIND